MNMFFNFASIILGVSAWVLPCIVLFKKSTAIPGFMCGSFGLCIASLCFQFMQIKYLIGADFSAIDDTIGFIVFAAITLSAITLILNVGVLIKSKKNAR